MSCILRRAFQTTQYMPSFLPKQQVYGNLDLPKKQKKNAKVAKKLPLFFFGNSFLLRWQVYGLVWKVIFAILFAILVQ